MRSVSETCLGADEETPSTLAGADGGSASVGSMLGSLRHCRLDFRYRGLLGMAFLLPCGTCAWKVFAETWAGAVAAEATSAFLSTYTISIQVKS